MNNKVLKKYKSKISDETFYISSGCDCLDSYNMENDTRKIKQIRVYSCLGVDPECPETDNIFPDTQLVFAIDGNLLKKFSFNHNGDGNIYTAFSSNISVEYIHPDVSNFFRDGIDEPWSKIFYKCFVIVFFEDDIEENNKKNNKCVNN